MGNAGRSAVFPIRIGLSLLVVTALGIGALVYRFALFTPGGEVMSDEVSADGGVVSEPPAGPATAIVAIRVEGCGTEGRGVGVVIGPNTVATNAHVVAGAARIDVDGVDADVLAFDPNADLALLSTDADLGPAAVLAEGQSGDRGDLVAIDAAGDVVSHRYEILRSIEATGDDIYGNHGASRQAFEVDVVFKPGWSGAGMFDDGGRLIGLAFAHSRSRPGIAYAVDGSELAVLVNSAGSVPASSGPCISRAVRNRTTAGGALTSGEGA